jgi:small conductance mechanosensitive channel
MELGIRMTKLFDMDNDNVKIIPNNEVRNVVHMTMRTSIVYNEFQIRYEERIEDVERIVREELKNAKKSPRILGGPVYIGVSSLGDNGVTMKMETKCHEPNRMKVTREVNHIVYTIFQKHNISVPYPQVTLHTGSDEMVEREP